MSLPTSSSSPDDAIVVAIPPDAAHFRMLRLTAAVVAADLLDVATVEDAQIGVEEAASLLLDAGPTGRIEAAMWCADDRLHVRLQGRTDPIDAAADPDDFRRTILEAVVEDLVVSHDVATGTSVVVFAKST